MGLEALLPDTVTPLFAAVLVVSSLITSAISAAFGLGGGVLLLAIMGLGLPPAALIPVHGIVQLGSNAGRAFVQRRHVTPWIVVWFGIGTVLGALVAAQFVITLPEDLWRIALGGFLLLITWMPKPKVNRRAKPLVFLNGGIAAVLTLFFGATGPFVLAINAQHSPTRQAIVATHAVNMTLQHLIKIAVFGFLGFVFAPWIPLIVAMVLSGYIGTLMGSQLLERFSNEAFRMVLKIVITALSLMILSQGLIGQRFNF